MLHYDVRVKIQRFSHDMACRHSGESAACSDAMLLGDEFGDLLESSQGTGGTGWGKYPSVDVVVAEERTGEHTERLALLEVVDHPLKDVLGDRVAVVGIVEDRADVLPRNTVVHEELADLLLLDIESRRHRVVLGRHG